MANVSIYHILRNKMDLINCEQLRAVWRPLKNKRQKKKNTIIYMKKCFKVETDLKMTFKKMVYENIAKIFNSKLKQLKLLILHTSMIY